MGYITAFDYGEWVVRAPALTQVPESAVIGILPIADAYWRNDGTSPATTPELQKTIYYLIIAHLVQLMYGTGATSNPSGIVGRITSASEGSVSVSSEWPTNPSNAWYLQTTYGAAFWQLTAAYRTMRYVAGPRRIFNPWPFKV